jgi:hypothetical protein
LEVAGRTELTENGISTVATFGRWGPVDGGSVPRLAQPALGPGSIRGDGVVLEEVVAEPGLVGGGLSAVRSSRWRTMPSAARQ